MIHRLDWRETIAVSPRILSRFLMTLALLGFVACTSNPAEKSLSEAFKQYETIIRWSQWDAAVDFLAPEYLQEHPVTRLEMERLRLFRVTAYTLRSTNVFEDGLTATQVVEIDLFNNTQGVVRKIIDEQEWRYNPTTKHWRLFSGLPDPTKRY